MADSDKLFLDWELRGTLEKQIKEAIKDVETLQDAIKKCSESGLEILPADKFKDNFRKSLNDAEKALVKFMEAREKAESALSSNKSYSDFGLDDSKLKASKEKLDEIIDRLMGIGAEAVVSKNYVKNLLAELSADTVLKSVNKNTKELVSNIDKNRKTEAKWKQESAKSQKDEENAAANNLKNQQKIQDAMAKIATARSRLSEASANAGEKERMHVELLTKLLDRLSTKLAELRKQDLGDKDALVGVLGSGYQGLMRNVATAISDLTSGKLNAKEIEAEEKINSILEMRAHKKALIEARNKAMEDEDTEAIVKAINRELEERAKLNKMIDQNKSMYMALNKVKLDTESQKNIAQTRHRTEEYIALEEKLKSVKDLMRRVKEEQDELANGTKKEPTLTKDVVTQELDAIQRRYNETLARGKQALQEEADAERKNADAKRKTAAATKEVTRVNAEMVNSFNKVLDRVTHSSRMLNQLQSQFAGFVGVYGIERLLRNVIQIGGEFEVQHIALQSILGDIQQANSMFEQMKELAVVSPFNFRQLASYSKQIAAFGIPYEEMYDTTKRLADMAAGLGVDMGRLILAYGQVRSAAVLRGQELRQFTEAGIPMVQALANEFTNLYGRVVSTAEVFELISKRAVPFEMVKKVMWDMTNEGGRFFDMQFTLSDTLAGKWSNLQDAWEIMLSEFAKGESLSGQFLKSMVTLLTKLTEAASSLMPLLAGGGLFMMMKKAQQLIGGFGLKGIDSYIKKTQQLYAEDLRRKYINQEITKEQYNQSLNANKSVAKYYVLLANEGRLKDYQIQRLLVQNKINNARLLELVKSGELTMREAAQVRLWRMKNGEVSAFNMRMKSLAASGLDFLKSNGWMIAIDVAITALTTWYARSEEAKAKNRELAESFGNSAKELKDAYGALNDNNLNNDDDYRNGIAGLKEQLKQHSANYDAIIRETNALEGLEAQYKYLKNALFEEAMVAYDAEEKAESFGEATRKAFEKANEYARYKTTGRQSFWDAMFGADTDVDRGLNKSIKELYEAILKEIPNVGKSEHANELYRQLRNSIEEQLGIGNRDKMLINIKLNELFGIDNIEDATTLVVDKFDEMLKKASPEIANKIRYGQELKEAEQQKVAELVNDAAEETKKRYPYYANTLQKLLNDSNFVANVQIRFSTNSTSNELQNMIYGNFPLTTNEKVKQTATSWATSGSMYEARNSAKRDIDVAYNELVSRQGYYDKLKKGGKATEKKLREAQAWVDKQNAAYKELVYAALYGLGYDYEGEKKKSNKTPGGSKKDLFLQEWKDRISLLEKYRSELDELEKLMGRVAAENKLRKDDNFASLWKYFTDPSDYKGSLGQAARAMGDMPVGDRKKFVEDVNAKKQAEDTREWKDSVKDAVSELTRMLGVMKENYDTYRKWLDLTGDANLAAKVAGVTQNTTYADYLKERMTGLLKKTNLAITADDIFGLSEGEARKFGESSEIFKVWTVWQDNAQKVRKEQWSLYEEAIKNAKDYDDKIADVNRDLEKQIEAIKTLGGDNSLIESARQNAADKVSELQWEKFQKENDWGRVFNDLDDMSLATLKKMVDAMKKFQKETRLNEKETRAWQKAMKDVTYKKITLDPINELTTAVKNYNTAVTANREARKRMEEADKKVAAISSEVATNPQAAAARDKRLKQAVKEQQDANAALIKSENDLAETFNVVKKAAAAIGDTFSDLGGKLSSFGSSVGGDIGNVIGGFGTMFSKLGSGISSIQGLNINAKGFAGIFNKVSVIMTVVTSMIEMNKALADILPSTQSIYEKHAEEQKRINQLREAVDSYRVAVAKAHAEEIGWIGSDPLKELQDAYTIHGKVLDSYTHKLYEAQEAYVESSAGIMDAIVPVITAITAVVAVVAGAFTGGLGGVAVGVLGSALAGSLAGALGGVALGVIGGAIVAGVGSAIGQAIQAGIDAITYKNGQVDARSNMKVQTQHRTFFRGEKTQNLEEWVRENLGEELFVPGVEGVDLIDLNVAKEVLDSGITLVGETRDTLEKLMELREQYDEWTKSIKDYISSSFGGLADNMVNAIWDWLGGGKDALDSFRDYASDTFRQIAQDAVKTFLKVAVLDTFEEQLEKLYKAYSMKGKDGNRVISETELMLGVASIAGDMADAFSQVLPVAQNLGEVIAEAFKYQGYDVVNGKEGSGSATAGGGIKAITEQTADMMAGYINAIRADVSVNRSMVAVYYPQFLNVMSQGNTIANVQLEQLRNVAENTRRNAEFAEMIYLLLHSVAPDGTKFHVR